MAEYDLTDLQTETDQAHFQMARGIVPFGYVLFGALTVAMLFEATQQGGGSGEFLLIGAASIILILGVIFHFRHSDLRPPPAGIIIGRESMTLRFRDGLRINQSWSDPLIDLTLIEYPPSASRLEGSYYLVELGSGPKTFAFGITPDAFAEIQDQVEVHQLRVRSVSGRAGPYRPPLYHFVGSRRSQLRLWWRTVN